MPLHIKSSDSQITGIVLTNHLRLFNFFSSFCEIFIFNIVKYSSRTHCHWNICKQHEIVKSEILMDSFFPRIYHLMVCILIWILMRPYHAHEHYLCDERNELWQQTDFLFVCLFLFPKNAWCNYFRLLTKNANPYGISNIMLRNVLESLSIINFFFIFFCFWKILIINWLKLNAFWTLFSPKISAHVLYWFIIFDKWQKNIGWKQKKKINENMITYPMGISN